MSVVALIPARAGSKRIPSKNIKLLAGHPLLAYTISAARQSGVFTEVIVSTEDNATGMIALDYGVRWLDRPDALATDLSPDIDWIRHALGGLREPVACFSILRPTSPFRSAEMIRRAWDLFMAGGADSLRAIEPVTQHPSKMWIYDDVGMSPLLPSREQPHSQPIQALPPTWVQNGSLEMAWVRVLAEGSITGECVMPFIAAGHEGFDINTPADWREAEYLIASGAALLPEVHRVSGDWGGSWRRAGDARL